MKKSRDFTKLYLLLVVAQMIICDFFNLTQYVTLSILPAMILCLPLNIGPALSMLIAFATGLTVDFLADGLPGLNALALVPVAFLRLGIIRAVFGNGLLARYEKFSIQKSGPGKVALAVVLVQTVFLAIYIAADCAGTRPLWFLSARFGCSLVAGTLLSMLIVDILSPDDR